MRSELSIRPNVDYLLDSDSFRFAAGATLFKPISVCLHVNHWCNLKCSYCLSDSGPAEKRTAGLIEESVNLLSSWAPLRLVWSGGEPVLHKDILRLLEISSRASQINILTTNGTASPKEELLSRTAWVDISLHGTNRETFLRTTGRDHFDLVLRNMTVLTGRGVRVSASLVLLKRFVPGIFELALRLRDAGIRRFRVSRLLALGRGRVDIDEDPGDDEVISIRERLLALVPEISVVLPAVRKRRALLDGYFVIENDGRLSSPPRLVGKTLLEAPQAAAWQDALTAHQFLFDGVAD